MAAWGGELDFFSFDRTPDALFGDDVKTRNTIVVSRLSRPPVVRSTGLLRWTSRTRPVLFDNIKLQEVDVAIDRCVPKLGSREERDLYAALRRRSSTLSNLVVHWSRWLTRDLLPERGSSLTVAPTAYNWLGAVLDPTVLVERGHDAETAFHCLRAVSSHVALALYAVMASRISYFMWRCESDGFHVTREFLANLPVPTGHADLDQLAYLGAELWEKSRFQCVRSVNKGRTSIALPPSSPELLDRIDSVLLGSLDIGKDFDLKGWHENCIVVDATDPKRRHLSVGKGAV
jgi:hypothetical protein